MRSVLVLGGTGMLGAPVARRLREDGAAVRVLSRDPEEASSRLGADIEIVPGDATEKAAVAAAMRGCEAVHVSVAGPAELPAVATVAELARTTDVRRITYVSGATVAPENRWFPMTAQKLDAEAAIEASGVPFTIFRPTWPMEQAPRFARGGAPLVVADSPHPYRWFAADDMARMVSRAIATDGAAGKRLYVMGPEAFTMPQLVERYCRVFHPEVTSVQVMPIDAARQAAKATDNAMLGFFAELMAYFEKVGEPGDPTEADALLGAPSTTFDAWLAARRSE